MATIRHRRNASFANNKQRLTLKKWHDILGYIDPAATKHSEKRGLIQVCVATVATDMRRTVCRECKTQALSYGRGGRSPKPSGEVIHTDLEGPFHRDVTVIKYFQVFVDEATRDKRIRRRKARDATAGATASTKWRGKERRSSASAGTELENLEDLSSSNACWQIGGSGGEAHRPGYLNPME